MGQGSFRIRIAHLYNYECAVSDTKVLPALDAAHIRPYAESHEHDVRNGLFLRKDIHSVFDAGFATVDKNLTFVVSDKVREVFNNGNEYRRLHGTKLKLPEKKKFWPLPENLAWHRENLYKG